MKLDANQPLSLGSEPTGDAERLRAYYAQQHADLLAADPGVRLGGDAEPVHEMRVAVRRLRALLRAARPVFVREWADELRTELGWLGLTAAIDAAAANAAAYSPRRLTAS